MNVESKKPERRSLHVTTGQSSLGLVARSERGLRAVLLGDDRDLLLADLRCRFPKARLVEEEPSMNPVAARVIACVDSPARELDVPLDLDGTGFQRIVWQARRETPAGSTVT
jgi:AraC family transcriptional regulator of adaptative response/methylated-DNA-[protein]-cysteine methyltransferase